MRWLINGVYVKGVGWLINGFCKGREMANICCFVSGGRCLINGVFVRGLRWLINGVFVFCIYDIDL